ncbi:Crp/Fnr family transcriptional regulator [Nitratidesulfovibrio liaohensis]|uniref:Crp/Fnr family transcriptional regulator n=1 Tax=Nitratidesulfovibrio liaohensis TaxID=2604158 RepID=UPI00141F5AB2|nr:Crp/Fnr family transcriptional regulator [Nitratidesulfovibrio liaohensis]NHZ48870.1 Crp/Fnr family transcriptional regulator [Nitratidesulfovibrio liaohensis]
MPNAERLFDGAYIPPWLVAPVHDDWERVAHLGRPMRWARKSVVYDIGAPSSEIVLIREGLLRIIALGYNGEQRTIGILGPGSILGEASLFFEVENQHVIKVVEPCSGLVFGKDVVFGEIIGKYPSLTICLCRNTAAKSYIMSTQLECTTFMTSEQKIAHFLYHLAGEQRRGTPLYHRLARLPLVTIGELLGLHRVTTTNVINGFRRAGILSPDADHLDVRDVDGLVDILYAEK